ncbi:MAG: TatD family hydrolase [Prolixibacteraceae bacterium]|nr:TatD family hydrolase [Prolixibacteraceae bacterium]
MLIDSHSHIYSEDFNDDRDEAIKRALKAGVKKIILPNIDSSSVLSMLDLADKYPEICFPLMGLHPTSVKEDYKKELEEVDIWFEKRKFYGVGEIGIDLYWDKTFLKQQEDAFLIQVRLAKRLKLPIVIHVRNSFSEVYNIIEKEACSDLNGIFHCFTGSNEEAQKILNVGFKIGIGGVVTFKNSNLDVVLKNIGLEHIVLETDSPYLTPIPFRGKRNESSYLIYVAQKIAEIYSLPIEKVGQITSENVINLFGI